MDMHRGSEKIKSNRSCPKNRIAKTGTENMSVTATAAVMVDCSALLLPFALCFVISLDTVRGIPEDVAVTSTANTDSAS